MPAGSARIAPAAGTAARRRGAGARGRPSRSTRSTEADLGPLLERIGDCAVVLLGEASHGTSEFYRMRARITRELITPQGLHGRGRRGRLARRRPRRRLRPAPPAVAAGVHRRSRRFPTWMWRNREVRRVRRLAARPQRRRRGPGPAGQLPRARPLQPLHVAATRCSRYLDRVDPAGRGGGPRPLRLPDAVGARPGRATAGPSSPGASRAARTAVVAMLTDLLAAPPRLRRARRRRASSTRPRTRGVVADAERYYRVMYYGLARRPGTCATSTCSRPCRLVRAHRGPGAKVVVWEHNSHIGDASATEMGARGEHNVGQLCRRRVRRRRLPGRLRHRPRHGRGRVRLGRADGGQGGAAVARPTATSGSATTPASRRSSCTSASPTRAEVRDELAAPRLERAIGVIYRPETELQSHYFQAVAARAVRRVRLVRRDDRGDTTAGPRAGRGPGHLPLRPVTPLLR